MNLNKKKLDIIKKDFNKDGFILINKLIVSNKNSKNKVFAMIFARGGSKSIPRKNIKEFCQRF